MTARLYLDTARLGRISGSARAMQMEYLELAYRWGASHAFDSFLEQGPDAWPAHIRRRYPALSKWRGVSDLKASILDFTNAEPSDKVLLASRSHWLMRIAARLLMMKAERVLVVDLGWPPFQKILRREAARLRKSIVEVAARESVLQGADPEDVVKQIVDAYKAEDCHAIFLPAVSNDGIRLPVEQIIGRLRQESEVRFAVVDGAQEISHLPKTSPTSQADLYLAGVHKWLRGFHPLGIGIYGRSATAGLIARYLTGLDCCGVLDDPLMKLTRQLELATLDGVTETMNLCPLFSARGALADAQRLQWGVRTHTWQRDSVSLVSDLAQGTGWKTRPIHDDFQTGILMLRTGAKKPKGSALRAAFAKRGVTLTAYSSGEIRLSMPRRPLRDTDYGRIRKALGACA